MSDRTNPDNYRYTCNSLYEKQTDQFGRTVFMHVYRATDASKKAAIKEYLQACDEESGVYDEDEF